MSKPSPVEPLVARWASTWITVVLVAAAVVHVGFHVSLGLGQEDVDRYESPLMLSVARQLVAGPWELYGPFGGANPLVLIHAPLYYRAAGLLAWPISRSGLHPVEAARIAGRLISAAGLAATLLAAYRLGRLGGRSRRAGWWAMLLLAASPVLAGQPFAVRPDMAGVALETWGAVLVLESLAGPGRRLGWGSLLFGLAACVKQHLVGTWAVSALLMAVEWWRGNRRFDSVALVLLPGVAVTVVVYGAEWFVTGGRIWQAAFVAAANVGRVHPGDWLHVGTVVAAMAGKSAGLAALAATSAVAVRQRSRRPISVTASLLVATITVLSVVQLVMPVPWVAGTLALAALVALAMALAGCVRPIRIREGDGPIDAALATYCMIELILLVVLCRSSSGAWINYGIPAVVFATVLVARALVRTVDAMPGIERAIPALAGTAMLASALMDAKVESTLRRAERADVARIVRSTGLPPAAVFFADRPGLNRMNGRLDWVYDDWLYPVFDSLRLAEPRARWLRSLLGDSGSVRAVVLESDAPQVAGIPEPLPALGFAPAGRFGPFRVWTRGILYLRGFMSESRSTEPKVASGTSAWITVVLAVSAAATVGYWCVSAVGEADTEAMESPLMLSVARQLVAGPWELYGPFGGANPLVLIHAPLYYRAAGLLAWPMARAGLHPVEAARIAGRLISAAGLAATLLAAYRLGRLGGRLRRAGWWAMLLLAASPVLAGQPFAVRPDMAGVALETWGAVLVLESLAGPGRRLGWGSLLFGLAACVKQHLVGAWAVSVALLAVGWLHGRVGLGAMARAVVPGVAVAGLVYGVEWLVTGGRIWEAAFVAAANVGRIHPGGWDHVWLVFLGIANQSAGLVAMLAAAALIAAGSWPGLVRRLLTGAGTVAIGLVVAALVVRSLLQSPWTGVAAIAAAGLAAVLALPAVALSRRAASPSNGNDAALWAYFVTEVGLVTLLSAMSAGAWLNYAIPATVFASVLAARALARAVEADTPRRQSLPAALAALAMLTSSLYGLRETVQRQRVEDAMLERIYERLERPRSSYFFTDHPGRNRVNGRLELVYDDWLYPVFESLGLAESRSSWLGPPLALGPVRAVINTNDGPVIDGTSLDLRRLGYRPDVSLGPFFVWTR